MGEMKLGLDDFLGQVGLIVCKSIFPTIMRLLLIKIVFL